MRGALFAAIVVLLFPLTAIGGDGGKLSQRDRNEIVTAAADMIRAAYVDPSRSGEFADQLKSKGSELGFSDPWMFANALTDLLRAITDDRHMTVNVSEVHKDTAPQASRSGIQQPVRKVALLDGNIGYLELTSFRSAPGDNERLGHALSVLSEAHAVIIDLRGNKGGHTDAVRELQGYFLPAGTVAMTYHDRENPVEVSRVHDVKRGPLFAGRPLYVLIDRHSGSAAEDFAYGVRHLGYGEVVGERSFGAAHSVRIKPLPHGFSLKLSTGKPVHPITNDNWEAKGVDPDIEVAAAKALDKAHLAAVVSLPDDLVNAHERNWIAVGLTSSLGETSEDPPGLQSISGYYDGFEVALSPGGPVIKFDSGERLGLHHLDGTIFGIGDGALRVQFDMADGSVRQATLHKADGPVGQYQRFSR